MKYAFILLCLLCAACGDGSEQQVATSVSPALAGPAVVEAIDVPIKATKVLEHLAETHVNMEVESDEDSSLDVSFVLPKG